MYSRRSTVNGFPMCVEGPHNIPTYRHIRLTHSNVFGSQFTFLFCQTGLNISCCFHVILNQHHQMINSRHVLSKVAAACIELQSPFSASRATKVFQPQLLLILLTNKKCSSRDDIPPLWPLTLIFIRNVWSKQKKKYLLCPSQCPVLKTLIPLRYTRKKKMKKKCFIELQKYYILSRCPLFHLRPAVERVLLSLPHCQKVNCVLPNKASTKFLLSTSVLAYVHTPINQHIWVQFKHGFFTKSDRFTNTV